LAATTVGICGFLDGLLPALLAAGPPARTAATSAVFRRRKTTGTFSGGGVTGLSMIFGAFKANQAENHRNKNILNPPKPACGTNLETPKANETSQTVGKPIIV